MYKALTLIVVPIHRIEVLVNWFSRISSRFVCCVLVEETFLLGGGIFDLDLVLTYPKPLFK